MFVISCLLSGFICNNALEPANKCDIDPLFLAKNSSIYTSKEVLSGSIVGNSVLTTLKIV
jgi:hypothetical protein